MTQLATRSRPKPAPRAGKGAAAREIPEPDLDAAMRLVMEMMAIPGTSGQEGRIVEYIRDKLREAGVPDADVMTDTAHQRSPLKGEVGNLICKFPGTLRSPRRLLMAHLDTVPLCVGSQPVLRGDYVCSANPKTGLGADDRSGAACILAAALAIVRNGLPHPPLTFFWPVQEEVGLHGAQHASLAALGKPRLAFNWDGGAAEKVTIGATGAYRLRIEVAGLASHAGVAPEMGVSAIAIASLAIAELHAGGWHGDIEKRGRHGTSNIGYIHGGGATNVVTDRVELKAEARSHDPKLRLEIVEAMEQAFKRAAKTVRSAVGATGTVDLTSRLDYEAFLLGDDEPCVLAAEAAIRSIDGEPARAISNGGLDANWMTARGIPTVTLGAGQQNVHTVSERLDVPSFQKGCRIALRLATATES